MTCLYLMVFGCNGKSPHVGVNVDRLLKTGRRLVRVIFLVAVSSVHIVGGGVVLVPLGLLVSRDLAEGLASLVPLFSHFVEICCSAQHLLRLILFAGTSEDMKHREVSIIN